MAEELNINPGLPTNPGTLSSNVVMNTPALGYDGINQFDYEDVIDRIEIKLIPIANITMLCPKFRIAK